MSFNLPAELNKIENPYERTTLFAGGTSYHNININTSYVKLCILFGGPDEGDSYKVSSEWTFKGENGEFFSIYDWKATNLYDTDSITVDQLRSLSTHDWHIGAVDRVSAIRFKEWVEKKLNSVVTLSKQMEKNNG